MLYTAVPIQRCGHHVFAGSSTWWLGKCGIQRSADTLTSSNTTHAGTTTTTTGRPYAHWTVGRSAVSGQLANLCTEGSAEGQLHERTPAQEYTTATESEGVQTWVSRCPSWWQGHQGVVHTRRPPMRLVYRAKLWRAHSAGELSPGCRASQCRLRKAHKRGTNTKKLCQND